MEKIEPSSWIKYLRYIKDKGYTPARIMKKFYQMVDKSDYERRDVPNLLKHAFKYGSTKPL